jgi:hypothetical protein
MASATPSDASWYERARDVLLRGFVHPRVGVLLNGVAMLVTLLMLGVSEWSSDPRPARKAALCSALCLAADGVVASDTVDSPTLQVFLVGGWAALGLYMDVPNGWHDTLDVCTNSSRGSGIDDKYAEGALRASHVPVGADGRHVATYCA